MKNKLAVLSCCVASLAGCKVTNITEAYFDIGPSRYSDPQEVTIVLPENTSSAYLTTNTLDPEPKTSCLYSGEKITLTRPTQVKVVYTVNDETFSLQGNFIIESGIRDAGYANRDAIDTWEDFFANHVFPQFHPSMDGDSTLVVTDSDGGSISLQTEILDRTPFTNVPSKGRQTYSFNFYKYTDPDSGRLLNIHMGKLQGVMEKDEGGYYKSLTRASGDNNIYFSGAFNGFASGSFFLDADGNTTSGEYLLYCSDRYCASSPVPYILDTSGDLIEIDPATFENTWECKDS